ncbi:hypothetical protein SAMN06296427_101362 [Moheibacter sediminis]|uniref:Uncharacterized protein n=1 Tax=Moheibacter sediminis TaxID=1434700 RepID=A0A1W1YH42_9FLAO|nr:hypothetical protein SAMN06296427_101362 [Moheibacter sediminis]
MTYLFEKLYNISVLYYKFAQIQTKVNDGKNHS